MRRHHYHRGRRLQRRLFVWFGVTIVLTGALMSALTVAFGERFGHDDYRRVEAFVGNRFAEVWDDEPARNHLAEVMASDLRLRIALFDNAEHPRGNFGEGDCWGRPWRIPAGTRGALEVCFPHRNGEGVVKLVLLLFGAAAGLWIASAFIARRLVRPLRAVAEVAAAIGGGNLGKRAAIDCREPDEVSVLARSINDMADRIEQQLRGQKELLAVVSHELRTPLGHLRLIAELVSTAEGEERARLVREFEKEILEIDALVGELLDQSRLEFGILKGQPVDPVEIASRALERRGLPKDRLAVEGSPGFITADPTLLQRALANLLDNADRHGGGLVRLLVRATSEEVVFLAEDRGRGLPADPERLFAPFRPLGEASSLGLGLSLVKRIAEAHGGRVIAENRPDGGAAIGVVILTDRGQTSSEP